MTEMLQKTENLANENSQDLTQQWKKGELPNGWYWVKGIRAEGIYAYTAEYLNNMYRPRNGERIIEQVPSYEQWQKHRKTLLKTQEKNCDLEIINTQLKELLKEYKNQLSEIKNAYIDLTTQDEYGSYYIDEAKLFVEIIGKTIKDFDEHRIDNAIGEK